MTVKVVLKKEKSYRSWNKSLKREPNNYKIKLLLSTSSSGITYQLQIRHGKTMTSYKCIHNYPSTEDNVCLNGRGMLSPKCWVHSPYSVALCPLYVGVLQIIDIRLGLLVDIVHLCIQYIGRIYSHVSKNCIYLVLGTQYNV